MKQGNQYTLNGDDEIVTYMGEVWSRNFNFGKGDYVHRFMREDGSEFECAFGYVESFEEVSAN